MIYSKEIQYGDGQRRKETGTAELVQEPTLLWIAMLLWVAMLLWITA